MFEGWFMCRRMFVSLVNHLLQSGQKEVLCTQVNFLLTLGMMKWRSGEAVTGSECRLCKLQVCASQLSWLSTNYKAPNRISSVRFSSELDWTLLLQLLLVLLAMLNPSSTASPALKQEPADSTNFSGASTFRLPPVESCKNNEVCCFSFSLLCFTFF